MFVTIIYAPYNLSHVFLGIAVTYRHKRASALFQYLSLSKHARTNIPENQTSRPQSFLRASRKFPRKEYPSPAFNAGGHRASSNARNSPRTRSRRSRGGDRRRLSTL